MTRALVVLNSQADRDRACRLVQSAPFGTRIEAKGARRTNDQNSKLWACLTDVASQVDHNGKRYTPDQWKVIFMHACGREVQFIPALDGQNFIPWGQSSRDLSKDEMSDLLEFIIAWGAENGVRFHDMEAV